MDANETNHTNSYYWYHSYALVYWHLKFLGHNNKRLGLSTFLPLIFSALLKYNTPYPQNRQLIFFFVLISKPLWARLRKKH